MPKSVLIVDEDDTRRRALCHAFGLRGVSYLEAADAFGAMAALGRADFGAVVASEGRRHLSLRGLCQLARKRHQSIALFVVQRSGSDAEAIRQIVGEGVEILGPLHDAEAVAAKTVKALSRPLHVQLDIPTTHEALDIFGTSAARTSPNATFHDDEPTAKLRAASRSEPAPVEMPVTLEGSLDGGQGPALLIGLFGQDLTGRLLVTGGAAGGTLYFYRGEPVWADDPKGDAGLYARLIQRKLLDPKARVDAVPEGHLLASLVQKGALTGEAMHDFMRELVRDRVVALADQQAGTYRFVEDRSFLDVAPLLKVNPFGLVFESRRRKLPPQQLFTLSAEIERKYLLPAPGLALAADKIAPFCRGARITDLVSGMSTVRAFCEAIGLDSIMGTLVVATLQDCRLVTLSDEPWEKTGQVTLTQSQPTAEPEEITVVDAEVPAEASDGSDEARRSREDILGLYTRLKPVTAPRQILQVGYDVDAKRLDAAYAARMRELDALKVPGGSAEALLYSRIEELRRKVTSAYHALQLQLATPSGPDDTLREKGEDSNPF